jgi:hypothetical protein
MKKHHVAFLTLLALIAVGVFGYGMHSKMAYASTPTCGGVNCVAPVAPKPPSCGGSNC